MLDCLQDQFAVSSDSQRSVLSLASNGLGVWVAMQGSAVVRLFHAFTHECICDVNLAPAVNKMLSGNPAIQSSTLYAISFS
jgi:hypothetical protein